MGKLVFALIAAFSVALTSCSVCDSEPIEPKIIGSDSLQYESKSGTWFVVIDTTQYTIAKVTIPDHNPRSLGKNQDIEPVDGMLVTVFTSHKMTGIQAVTGEKSVEEIEELYKTNSSSALILFGLLLFCVCCFGVIAPKDKEIPVENTDE